MAEPAEPRAARSMRPAEERTCEGCGFVRRVLIPEMIHDRYFCEPGSREFVELDSVDVEHLDRRRGDRGSVLHRVTARIKFSDVTHCFPLIVKLAESHMDLPAPGSFLNEEMFYSKMTHSCGTDGVPRCYLSDLGRYGRAAIVLEDLAARGYTRVHDELDEDHLKLCAKALAKFHGRGLRLRAHRFPLFREFYAKLSVPTDWLHLHTGDVRTSEAQSDNPGRLDFSSYPALPVEAGLSEKIRKKRDETAELKLNDFWTICHGNFARNNLLFKYENGRPSDVKVIDWSAMRYCSPSIDFGNILLQNLLDDDDLSKVEESCQNILRVYLDAVKDEYPEVDRELLKREIIAKLPFAYGMIEDRILKKAGTMLHALDRLGSFD